jgi:HSP20 family protein
MNPLVKFQRFEPFDPLTNLKTQMDRMLARFTPFPPEYEEELFTGQWAPLADVVETKEAIIIRTELPGLTEKEIAVEFENGVLTIHGERKFEKETPEKGYRRLERSYGKFIRSFTIPPNVETNKIAALYNNGLLELTIPKKEEAKPKTINVEVKKKLTAAA